jgi:hypothetical protein
VEQDIALRIIAAVLDSPGGIVGRVSRTTIDLEDDKLAAAARELGTTSKIETVNAALAYVAGRRQRAEAFDDPLIWGSPDLADPEVRAEARR